MLYSAAANRLHGLRPTKADRRKAVIRLLEDPEWGAWTNQQIAALCGAEPDAVRGLRGAVDRFLANRRPGEPLVADAAAEPPPTQQMVG